MDLISITNKSNTRNLRTKLTNLIMIFKVSMLISVQMREVAQVHTQAPSSVCKPSFLLLSLIFLREFKWFSHFVLLKAKYFLSNIYLLFSKLFLISEGRRKWFLSMAREISAESSALNSFPLACICKTLICVFDKINVCVPFSFRFLRF